MAASEALEAIVMGEAGCDALDVACWENANVAAGAGSGQLHYSTGAYALRLSPKTPVAQNSKRLDDSLLLTYNIYI